MNRRVLSAVAVLALVTPGALADFVDTHAPGFFFSVSTAGNTNGSASAAAFGSVTQVSAHEWFYSGAANKTGMGSLSWAFLVDPDPFITGTLTYTNTTSAALDYTIDFTLNIDPVLHGGSYIAGQFSGTLTDANGSGSASLTSIAGGGPVYTALGDGAAIQGLMSNASQSVSSPWGTTSFSGGSFGYPIGSMVGPAIHNTIGIRYAFTLSAGDSISFSSIFIANPVPAPGALALAFVGCVVGGRRRRR